MSEPEASGRQRVSEPTAGIDQFRTPRATCLLAPNPSPMTLDGTNTWLIAEPGAPSVVVVDPGPGRAVYRARLRRRSASRMRTERAEICSQPRAAKSASALLTVSLDAPTNWASSSCVRS